MTTTEELVSQVNKILDDIGIDMAGLFEDFDVVELAYTLKKNLSLLSELEEELERRVGESIPTLHSMDKKSRDPHIQWLYRKKRNRVLALERLRAAITAHKMALAHISANYEFYLGKSPIKVDSIKKDELGKIKAKEKPVKLGRIEVLPYLPYSGDVLRLLSREGIEVRETFKFIKGKLREKGTVRTRGLRIEVEYWSDKRLKRDRIDLPADADIEAELRKRYGRRFRWRVLSFVKTKGVLINNHYTVDNLSLAYALLDPKDGPEKLALDIFRYYFLTSPTERETLGLYPGIKQCVDCHYSLLDLPFKREPDFKVGYGSMLLIRKCEIENMLSGKRTDISSIPNYLLGGIVLYGITSWNEGKVSELLGINLEDLTEAIRKFVLSGLHTTLFSSVDKFEKFMPKSDKAKKFLSLLQG
ncbi:DUF530 family protein [Thermococcus gorgonarius]|uniref:DUF530 domain-containing protein n=1 Tax=Thermococcus gorgonarius TaxID=71997 RepID=A0A2Z2M8E7_THEGO|nr:DUF530 family protein [Thermococcus gorgonarius]ASJ00735.1 hypothetical protein A3K92_04200 [Thermococcus gorgonarius]